MLAECFKIFPFYRRFGLGIPLAADTAKYQLGQIPVRSFQRYKAGSMGMRRQNYCIAPCQHGYKLIPVGNRPRRIARRTWQQRQMSQEKSITAVVMFTEGVSDKFKRALLIVEIIKENIQIASKFMNKSLVIREMQIKTTMRYYHLP